MGKQSSFEWLDDYLSLKEDCRLLEWRIRRTENEALRWIQGDLANIHLTPESHGAHVGDKLPKLESELEGKQIEMNQLLKLVDTFHDRDEHELLKLRYVDGLELDEIADKMHRSYSWVKSKHAELHRRLDYLDYWMARREKLNNRPDMDYLEETY